MAKTDQITFRLKSVPRETLEAAAQADQRDITSLLNKLIADYIEAQELAEITKRRDDTEAGRANLITHTDAMAAWKPTNE